MPWSRNGHLFAYVRLWVSWEQRLTSGRGYTSTQLSTGQEAFLPEWKGYSELSSTPSASTWHSQVAPWKAGAWPRLPVCLLQGYSPTCLRERESNSGVGSSHGACLECGPVWAQLYSLGTPPPGRPVRLPRALLRVPACTRWHCWCLPRPLHNKPMLGGRGSSWFSFGPSIRASTSSSRNVFFLWRWGGSNWESKLCILQGININIEYI